ncbi:Tfp pilus assembly protein FimT/FimU [Psychromonas sp. MME1]|uniref:pilus assembly FimT family protein n=1 Tax=Psychromonas sp. MME1 TaxID=3231032 RepID=UPI0034E1BE71
MKKSGFTITEMVVTLSILAILLAIGAPNFKEFISNGNMVSNTNGMMEPLTMRGWRQLNVVLLCI